MIWQVYDVHSCVQRLLKNARDASTVTISSSSSSSSSIGSNSGTDDELDLAESLDTDSTHSCGVDSMPNSLSTISTESHNTVGCLNQTPSTMPTPNSTSTPAEPNLHPPAACIDPSTAAGGQDPALEGQASQQSSSFRKGWLPPWYALTEAANASTGQGGAPQPWWKLDPWLTAPAEAQFQR